MARATRALHATVGATEAFPGLSQLTGNVNAIAEEASRVSVQKIKCKNLANRCRDMILTFQSRRGLAGTDLQVAVDESEMLLEKILRKFIEWRDLNKLQRYLHRDEIGQGIEQLNQDMNVVTQRFMLQATAMTYQSNAEIQTMVRQEREETKNMLLDILKNQMGDVKRMAYQGDVHGIKSLMSGLQTTLQDDSAPLSSEEEREMGRGLVQIVHETNVLPPIKDLRNEVVLTSNQPVTGGVYSDMFVGTWHNEKVAVKGLRHIQATPPAVKSFEREVDIWSRVRHDNILALYGLTSFPGRATGKQLFMVSPWQDRGDILTFSKANPDADRLALLEGAASAFAYLHSQHIVHGNVRCANILVDEQARPLICHFGLSKMVEEVTETAAQMTLTSEPNYSRYLAPELIRGDITSPNMSTDVYSFGMAILECLTLEKPFANRKRDALVIKDVIVQNLRPNRPINDEGGCARWMSDNLWALLTQMWAERPDDRPSMQHVHATLLGLGADHPSSRAPAIEYDPASLDLENLSNVLEIDARTAAKSLDALPQRIPDLPPKDVRILFGVSAEQMVTSIPPYERDELTQIAQLLEVSPSYICGPLQPVMHRAQELVSVAPDIAFLGTQCIHLSRAFFHATVAFANEIRRDADITQEVMNVCLRLRMLGNRLQRLFNTILDHPLEPTPDFLSDWQMDLDEIFKSLSSERYGGQEIRQTESVLKKLRKYDWRYHEAPPLFPPQEDEAVQETRRGILNSRGDELAPTHEPMDTEQ